MRTGHNRSVRRRTTTSRSRNAVRTASAVANCHERGREDAAATPSNTRAEDRVPDASRERVPSRGPPVSRCACVSKPPLSLSQMRKMQCVTRKMQGSLSTRGCCLATVRLYCAARRGTIRVEQSARLPRSQPREHREAAGLLAMPSG
jgi:hypothetical protein